ncbi:sulfatase-like hydrolase/transferase [bacterium SPL81]|nr:sulfatase-like hydrolase/transferase [Acinetobacter baumannii]
MYFLTLFLLPNVYLYLQTQQINVFLLSLMIIIWLFAIFKNNKYLIIFSPFFLLLPIVLFYINFYSAMLDEQVLAIILETNIQEAKSFIGSYIYILFFCIFVLIYMSSVGYKKSFVWSHYSRWIIILLFTSYFFINFYISEKIADKIDENFDNNHFLVEEKNDFIQDLKKTYPLGLLVSGYDLYHEQKKISDEFNNKINFKFNAYSKNNKKQTIVLVIGESSRRENWQLNGYYRKTNPFLIKKGNLINLENMISVSNATRSSIPIMLTRKDAQKVMDYNFKEKSIISAFKEAGFSTYWLSTQQQFGAFDTSTSVYAREADQVFFLNKTSYSNKGDTDGVIIPKFKEIINNNENKKFIVIHMLGSHYDYSHRYPSEYDIFKPSLSSLKNYNLQDKRNKIELINSYDNSILYTDYVLSQFIRTLENEKTKESFLFFSSDHGEDLFDGECHKSGHGNQTIYNFNIASFIWYSNVFKENNLNKAKELEMNRLLRINQTSIFPTLIDAADIDIVNYSVERSVLKKISIYPRYIVGGLDYDKANYEKKCKEIK